MNGDGHRHLAVLDGWRGISILLVLATHLLPLGPKSWSLNEMTGPMGMDLFFTLSGFLITRFLLADADVPRFLVRRVFRIVPLAWLSLAIALPLARAPDAVYLPNFLFYANLPPYHLSEVASHFWSLGVEMQFYAGIALVVGLLGTRGLYLLPVLGVLVTLCRVPAAAYADIVTWYRIDEIMAGATLSLVVAGRLGHAFDFVVARASTTKIVVLLLVFMVASHPAAGFMNYLRPYVGAALIGATLNDPPARIAGILRSRALRYIAAISFALYVIHGLLASTWLGSGDKIAKYLKRPLLLAATFALAHVSTFYYEQRWIDFGRSVSNRLRRPAPT